jgi:predicted peptidase
MASPKGETMYSSQVIVPTLLVLLIGGCSTTVMVPTKQQSEQVMERDVTVSVPYLLYLPQGYNQDGPPWPLLLFLHGSGERGSDLHLVKRHGPPNIVEQGKHFPFILVSPQCPDGQWWSFTSLDLLLQDLTERYAVDRDRIYVTGLSMGGFATWTLATEFPGRFAAIAPICGGGIPHRAQLLRTTPIWAFHGANDRVIPFEYSQNMVSAVNAAGGNATLTIYPDAGHDAWTATYNTPDLYEWLLRHCRQLKETTQ